MKKIIAALLFCLALVTGCGNSDQSSLASDTNGTTTQQANVAWDFRVPARPADLNTARIAARTPTNGQELELVQAYAWQITSLQVDVYSVDDLNDSNGAFALQSKEFDKDPDGVIRVRLDLQPNIAYHLEVSAKGMDYIISEDGQSHLGEILWGSTEFTLNPDAKTTLNVNMRPYCNPTVAVRIWNDGEVFAPNALYRAVYTDTNGNQNNFWMKSDDAGNLSSGMYIDAGYMADPNSITIPDVDYTWPIENYDPVYAAYHGINLVAEDRGTAVINPVLGNADLLYAGIDGRIISGSNRYEIFLSPGTYTIHLDPAIVAANSINIAATEIYHVLEKIGPTTGGELPYTHTFTITTGDWHSIVVKSDERGDYRIRLSKNS